MSAPQQPSVEGLRHMISLAEARCAGARHMIAEDERHLRDMTRRERRSPAGAGLVGRIEARREALAGIEDMVAMARENLHVIEHGEPSEDALAAAEGSVPIQRMCGFCGAGPGFTCTEPGTPIKLNRPHAAR